MKIIKNVLHTALSCLGYQLTRQENFTSKATPAKDITKLITSLTPLSPMKQLIRFGPDSDGGYLIPDDLDGIEACFSPGVNTISGFEIDCANRNIPVFLADKSVEMPPDSHEQFHFIKKYIGSFENQDFMTMDSWVNQSLESKDSDLIMQIDIEGFEYETFLAMSQPLLNRFRIIVVEFHCLDHLWNPAFFSIASRVFEKLHEQHSAVHIHPNNWSPIFSRNGIDIPPYIEITFVRNDHCIPSDSPSQFPHPLDCDNIPEHPTIILPDYWYDTAAQAKLLQLNSPDIG